MNNNLNKKVEVVKSEHIELINMIKEKIGENMHNFQNHITEALKVLKYDNENIKKYEAMVNAQELIVNLTKQILEAKDIEEIMAIRKKLNYYINKIKNELKNRGISEDIVCNYQEKANTLRKGIADYIRFFKRENNICEIDRLLSNYDNLSNEELTSLKECITKENRYNKRNIKSLKDPNNKTLNSKKTLNIEKRENNKDFKQEVIKDKFHLPDRTNDENDMVFVTGKLPYEELSNYFLSRIDSFDQMYGVASIYEYEQRCFGKNVINFFRNLPRYIHNKKAIQKMSNDYFLFYRGDDLSSFIEYMKRKNSIYQGLKCIFDRSKLFSNESIYLNEHQKCARWMYNFCQEKSLTICVKKLAA